MSHRVLLTITLVACTGCSQQTDVLSRVRSPTRPIEAVHVRPKTDATVGFAEWVYVVDAGSEPKGDPLFVADKLEGPLQLRWSGDELTINAHRARVFKAAQSTTVRAPTGDVTVTLKVEVAEPVS